MADANPDQQQSQLHGAPAEAAQIAVPPAAAVEAIPMVAVPDDGGASNRKSRSLGSLCEAFLGRYCQEDNHIMHVDTAAKDLCVERRRIYDILNVLNGLGLFTKHVKSQYEWHGLASLRSCLQALQTEADAEMQAAVLAAAAPGGVAAAAAAAAAMAAAMPGNDAASITAAAAAAAEAAAAAVPPAPPAAGAASAADRKERSMARLTQRFAQMFMMSPLRALELEDAATHLLGPTAEGEKSKSKVRRLYDIANIMVALGLIEKSSGDTGKTWFRWLGADSIAARIERAADGVREAAAADAAAAAAAPPPMDAAAMHELHMQMHMANIMQQQPHMPFPFPGMPGMAGFPGQLGVAPEAAAAPAPAKGGRGKKRARAAEEGDVDEEAAKAAAAAAAATGSLTVAPLWTMGQMGQMWPQAVDHHPPGMDPVEAAAAAAAAAATGMPPPMSGGVDMALPPGMSPMMFPHSTDPATGMPMPMPSLPPVNPDDPAAIEAFAASMQAYTSYWEAIMKAQAASGVPVSEGAVLPPADGAPAPPEAQPALPQGGAGQGP